MGNNLLGVVLCGGESRRMGRDKGLLLKDGITWARVMADKLVNLGLEVVFSVNAGQVEHYNLQMPGAILVVDEIAIGGPLNGLLSVHTLFPDKDILLLACDMLDMDEATIAALLEVWHTGTDEFYAFAEGGIFQPLCSIYTAAALAAPHTAALMGRPLVISLQQLLRKGKTKSLVPLRSEAFRNYNTLV